MAWQDRLKAVRYTSPSGAEFEFIYENVSRESDKKTSEFIFPEKDGAYIQDLGRAGRRFPFTIYFSGEDYDIEADAFFNALEEKGIGKLEHPRYGTFNVIPTGTITQRDDLVTEANQAIFNVTFSETIPDITFPSSSVNSESNINNSVEDFSDASAGDFANGIDKSTNGNKINLQTAMRKHLSTISKDIGKPLRESQALYAQFQQISTSYENQIDSVFDNVEGTARQGILLIRTPSKLVKTAKFKTQIYSDMMTHLFSDFNNATESLVNVFQETNKNAMSCVASANEGMLYTSFSHRNEAIIASEDLLDLYDRLLDFQDTQIENLGIIDTGNGYDSLAKLVSLVAGYLISISFNLPKEKRIILGEERNCIELVSELYKDLDKLDYFIETNDLTCDEIEILPIGKEVVFYE